MDTAIQIRPMVGVNDVLLGSDRLTLCEALAEPDRIDSCQYDDGTTEETWCYDELGVEFVFQSDDDYLLGRIRIRSPQATLNGCRLIGLSEQEFLAQAKAAGLTIVLDDDLDALQCRDYVCDDLNLSFWVCEGRLENICLMPQYDEQDENVIWPSG